MRITYDKGAKVVVTDQELLLSKLTCQILECVHNNGKPFVGTLSGVAIFDFDADGQGLYYMLEDVMDEYEHCGHTMNSRLFQAFAILKRWGKVKRVRPALFSKHKVIVEFERDGKAHVAQGCHRVIT